MLRLNQLQVPRQDEVDPNPPSGNLSARERKKKDLVSRLINSQLKIKFSEYKMAYVDWSLSEEDLGEILADLNASRFNN